jgi:hypothetical protein
MEMTDSQLHELIAEAKEDEVGLWLVIAKVREELGVLDDDKVRESTISCVRRLLKSNEVEAGYYKPDGTGVEIWNLNADEIVSRIESGWEALGREPDIGEVVVFVGCRRM